MRRPPNATEPFYIAKLLENGIAREYVSDENGHCLLAGEQYVDVNYLEKIKECKGSVKYAHSKKCSPSYSQYLKFLSQIFRWMKN